MKLKFKILKKRFSPANNLKLKLKYKLKLKPKYKLKNSLKLKSK